MIFLPWTLKDTKKRLFLEQLVYLKDVEEIEIEFLKERVIMPDIEKFFEGEVRKIKF